MVVTIVYLAVDTGKTFVVFLQLVCSTAFFIPNMGQNGMRYRSLRPCCITHIAFLAVGRIYPHAPWCMPPRLCVGRGASLTCCLCMLTRYSTLWVRMSILVSPRSLFTPNRDRAWLMGKKSYSSWALWHTRMQTQHFHFCTNTLPYNTFHLKRLFCLPQL